MPYPKTSPGGFSLFSLFTAILVCVMPSASASTLHPREEPFYGPSSQYLYASTTVSVYEAPSSSAQLYTWWSVQPTGYTSSSSAAPYSSVAGTGLVPYPHNTTAPHPTGGMIHTVTPTWQHKTTSVLLTTVTGPSSAAPAPPSEASPVNGAENRVANFAGLVLAGGVAILAL